MKLLGGAYAMVVATPGRLCEFVESQKIQLHKTSYVVLDECDKLLKLGFSRQLAKIISRTRYTA